MDQIGRERVQVAQQVERDLEVVDRLADDLVRLVTEPDDVERTLIVEVSGEPELVDEGCLSVPGFSFPRMRYPYARVTGVDLDGHPVELGGTGLLAQALQHETDHLDGKLFIEGLDKDRKRQAMRLIRESDWF